MRMPGFTRDRVVTPLDPSHKKQRPRSEAKRSRIVQAARLHFAEHGYHSTCVGDIALGLGIAKGSIFQHFGSKEGLFLEVYKRAVRSFPKFLDAPSEVCHSGFFEVLRRWLAQTGQLVHENWIPYRISLIGNYETDLLLKREINRFLINEDPYGTASFVRFGLERKELRSDLDVEMIVSIMDWAVERFHDALLSEELDPGWFRRQGDAKEKKDVRMQQFLSVLRRAIGNERAGKPTRLRTAQRRPKKGNTRRNRAVKS